VINVLLESYDLTAPFLVQELRKHIKPEDRVTIIAFSFLPSQASNLTEWLNLYGAEQGMFYHWLVDPFAEFGIPEEHISFVNYFTDTKESAAEKVKQADIIYFTGGLPDAMMDRLYEFELIDLLENFDGVVLGCSAGAMIQLKEYHITPDWDYPQFGYYRGLPWLRDFYVEVHYDGTPEQKASIARVLKERGKPVYTSGHDKAAIIVDNGKIKLLGEADVIYPVTLKKLSPEDERSTVEILTHDTVKKTYMVPDLTDEAAKKLFIRLLTLSHDPAHYIRGIYRNDRLIGFINDTEIVSGTIELGWAVHPDFHKRGYATQAVTAAIDELLTLGFHEVQAGAFAENPASIRVMEKCGMKRIDKSEQIDYRGKVHDCVFYAIRGKEL